MTSTQVLVAAAAGAGGAAAALIVERLNRNAWRKPEESGTTHLKWWVVVPTLAVVAGGIVWRLGTAQLWPAAATALVLAVSGTPIVIIDAAVQRVPEPVVLAAYGLVAAVLVVGAAVTGDWGALGRAAACGALLWAGFFLYALVTSMGFGDVQLMGLAGLTLGWVGWWPGLMVGPVVLLVGSLMAICLLLAGRRGSFAFAPPIAAGFLLTLIALT